MWGLVKSSGLGRRGRGSSGPLGQTGKGLEGLAEQVGRGGSCARALGSSQGEDAREMRERAGCHQCHPPAGSHPLSTTQQGLPGLWFCLPFPGPQGREEEGREGDKLAAWPLSHLLHAVFQELQIHLSCPTPQSGPLLTLWPGTSHFSPQPPQKSKKELEQGLQRLFTSAFQGSRRECVRKLSLWGVSGRGDGSRELGHFP